MCVATVTGQGGRHSFSFNIFPYPSYFLQSICLGFGIWPDTDDRARRHRTMSQCCYNLKNTPLDPDGNTWTTDDLQLLGNRWRSMRPEEPGPKHFRTSTSAGAPLPLTHRCPSRATVSSAQAQPPLQMGGARYRTRAASSLPLQPQHSTSRQNEWQYAFTVCCQTRPRDTPCRPPPCSPDLLHAANAHKSNLFPCRGGGEDVRVCNKTDLLQSIPLMLLVHIQRALSASSFLPFNLLLPLLTDGQSPRVRSGGAPAAPQVRGDKAFLTGKHQGT